MRSSAIVISAVLLAACTVPPGRRQGADTLVVFAAASLARPLAAALDSFTATGGRPTRLVTGGSLDLARRITEMGEQPDLVALADEEILRRLLAGEHATWYARFGRNRLVIAYRERPAGAVALDSVSWPDVLTRPGVEIARADPARAPVGYRTLLAWRLAEKRLRRPGLARRLEARAPPRNVRGNEAEVLALVESGIADYAWGYESSARAAGLQVVRLPHWMDFGDPGQRAWYASDSVSVPGRSPGDSIIMRGDPIVYVFTVPTASPRPTDAGRLADFLLGARGRAALVRAGLDVIEGGEIVEVGKP